ncbi:hypothetical protein GobsT_65160 [Gemmata obscuriglobus]|uniref:hypothetical protein n=1 Tax=Gemmata obscuriglobus TaxID=114 RepID=UPI0011CCFAC3|nr:hypothetical protein [Gemmata obscuriglobus]QEG31672.1 hypothetical protein GobsT_65160 [Gemmata obscuriglobus]VTS11018.1 unnamed protein product [Gemmata obscuriglobus UQM 2246]
MRPIRLLTVAVIASVMLGCGEPQKYTDGKDTVDSFGDGTWTIAKTGGGPDNPRKLHLYSRETQEHLSDDLASWKRSHDWVYALDASGEYIILNYRTSESGKYRRVEDAPPEHQLTLRSLRR